MSIVVVGVDGSPMSIRALEWAIDYADPRGLNTVAVTGYEVPWTIFITPTYQEQDYARDAEHKLEVSVAQALRARPDASVETRLVPERPAVALTMASRGGGVIGRWGVRPRSTSGCAHRISRERVCQSRPVPRRCLSRFPWARYRKLAGALID